MATITAHDLQNNMRRDGSHKQKVSVFSTFKNSFLKDIQIQMRYKQNFVGQFIRTLVFILVFWMFSLSFAFNDLPDDSTGTVFLFFISALVLMMYDGVALWSPYETVRRDLYNGTLEAIYQTPSSRYAYFLGGIAAAAIYNSVFVIPLLSMIIIYSKVGLMTILTIGGTIFVALSTLMAMGIIIGLSAILWKNMGALINILSMIFQFVTGTIIPFASLPFWAQVIGYFLPITWGLDLIRYYLFQGIWTPIYPVPIMWAILVGQLLLFILFSKFLLGRVERYSKREGLHLL